MSAGKTAEQYEVIVLGGGKGGKTLAVDLGKKGIRTALIERDAEMIGGSCINVACIPTKTLIASARAVQAARHAAEFGVRTGAVAVDWGAVRRRTEGVVLAMRAMNHKNFTSASALDFILGTARFVEPRVIEVRDSSAGVRHLSAEKIFINTGTRPAQPNIPGLDSEGVFTSESIQQINELPEHLVVLGGSYVALEFAQMFRQFGSRVTVLERASQLLKKEDPDIVEALSSALRDEGVEIHVNCSIESIERGNDTAVTVTIDGRPSRICGSHVLAALGRSPNTEGLNLGAAGVAMDQRGFVKVNSRLETTAKGIWALGDVNGGPQFTHISLDDYRIVKSNVFDAGERTTTARSVPFTLFTEPELARIGLTESEARQQGFEIRIAKLPIAEVPRAKTLSERRGFIKVVIDANTDGILGCAILSIEAGEMLGTVQLAMIGGVPFNILREVIFAHPTMVEGFNSLAETN